MRAFPSTHTVVATVSFAITAVTLAAYVRDPHGPADTAFSVAGLVCLVACWLGPHLWKVHSWSTRMLPGTAATFFLAAIPARQLGITVVGFVQAADVLSFSGFGVLVIWIAGLSRRYHPRERIDSVIDLLLVAAGAGLILWSLAVAPSLAAGSVDYARTSSAVYCAWDVVLLTLTAQLLYRAGSLVVAMAWFLAALGVLLVSDVSTLLWWTWSSSTLPAAITSLYLVSFVAMALGLCHPSIRLLDRPPAPPTSATVANARRSGLFVVMVTPSLGCLLYPSAGALDMGVRGVFLTVVLALVYGRLRQALEALARSEEINRHRSLTDALTGLGNRASLAESLPRLAADARARGWVHAVLLMDFDGFKRINDTWGHAVGDDFLCAIADRLRGSTEWADVVVRLGGDEFLVAASAPDGDWLREWTQGVHDAFLAVLSAPRAAPATITASIGLALSSGREVVDPSELMRRADVALYAAKRAGRSRVVEYAGDVAGQDSARRRLQGDVEAALSSEQMGIMFEPVVAASGRVVGWEASARWTHPGEGLVPSDLFASLVEENGLRDQLTWVEIDRACRFLTRRATEARGAGDEWVAIDVAPRQLQSDAFGERFLARVHACGGSAAHLRVEVSEDGIATAGPAAVRSLAALRAAGVRVVVDHFGRGSAGIGLLRHAAVDGVKIDESFVTALGDEFATATLSGLVALLRGLRVPEIAVAGVTTQAQARIVADLAVDAAQGCFYGLAVQAAGRRDIATASPVPADVAPGPAQGVTTVEESASHFAPVPPLPSAPEPVAASCGTEA